MRKSLLFIVVASVRLYWRLFVLFGKAGTLQIGTNGLNLQR